MPDIAIDVDARDCLPRDAIMVTVRVHNVWRLWAALTVLRWAIVVVRLLGVGVRLSVSGRRAYAK